MTVSLKKPTDEQWKTIPGHKPYEACDLGKIRNGKTRRILRAFLTGHRKKQYLTIRVSRTKMAQVHKLVLLAFVDEKPDGQYGLHKDDNSLNNNLSNLYWGTARDNAFDRIKNGLFTPMKGEKNGNTKFSDEMIKKIRAEYTGKHGDQTVLAKKYGMTAANIWMIVKNKTRAL